MPYRGDAATAPSKTYRGPIRKLHTQCAIIIPSCAPHRGKRQWRAASSRPRISHSKFKRRPIWFHVPALAVTNRAWPKAIHGQPPCAATTLTSLPLVTTQGQLHRLRLETPFLAPWTRSPWPRYPDSDSFAAKLLTTGSTSAAPTLWRGDRQDT